MLVLRRISIYRHLLFVSLANRNVGKHRISIRLCSKAQTHLRRDLAALRPKAVCPCPNEIATVFSATSSVMRTGNFILPLSSGKLDNIAIAKPKATCFIGMNIRTISPDNPAMSGRAIPEASRDWTHGRQKVKQTPTATTRVSFSLLSACDQKIRSCRPL